MMYGNGLLFPFNYVVHEAFLVSKCVSKKSKNIILPMLLLKIHLNMNQYS